MWCKSLRIEKYISFRMKWFFGPPFLSVSPFLLLNLARRQSYAYAIGLYTRPEIKSRPDIKFCAHAHCVLPRCLAERPLGHRKSSLVLSARFPGVKWRSRSVAKSAYYEKPRENEKLTWLRGFLVIFPYLVRFSLCSSLFWQLRDNGVMKNLQF